MITKEFIIDQWNQYTEQYGLAFPARPSVTIEIDAPVSLSDTGWFPRSTQPKALLPKRRKIHISYLPPVYTYRTQTPITSQYVAICLQILNDQPEKLAFLGVYAGLCQLEVDYNLQWDHESPHRQELQELKDICAESIEPYVPISTSGSKWFFPKGFYAKELKRCYRHFNASQVIKLCALNLDYYLRKWMIVHYRLSDTAQKEFTDHQAFYERHPLAPAHFDSSGKIRHRVLFSTAGADSPARFSEGARIQSYKTTIERNAQARKMCLQHHGTTCAVCGINFGERYGDAFQQLIEVHHLHPLHAAQGSREVDPITDLVPLCPNCHRMIHYRTDGCRSIEELRRIVLDAGHVD